MMRRILIAIAVAGLATTMLAGGAHGLSEAMKCEAGKLKVAGKYDFCRLKAEAKAAKLGGLPDFSKCDLTYSSKWASTELAGGGMCPSNGDQAVMQTFVTEYTEAVAVALAGGGLPAPVQQCTTDLTTCNTTSATCATNLTTTTTNLTACNTTATTCNTNLTTCNTNLTAALACGNGAIDGGEQCDLGTLNGATCVTQSFAGGVLRCGNGCVFDTSGYYNARFVDTANGAITDNQTGLQWEKKVKLDSTIDFANLHDANNPYKWSGTCSVLTSKYCQPTAAAATLCAANAEGGTTGCAQCTGGDGTCNAATTTWTVAADLNTASFAGHSDWRVPTRQELEGILDLTDTTSPVVNAAFQGASCGVACTDITNAVCSCTQSDFYWSATTYAPSPQLAWIAYYYGGYVGADFRPSDFYLRVVRSGS